MANNRRRQPGSLAGETMLLAGAVGLALLVIVGVNLGLRVGNRIEGKHPEIPSDPIQTTFQVFLGDLAWPRAGTWVLVGTLVLLVALGLGIARWFAGVNVANVLADAGLEPRRHYFVIMDELWQALRSGTGMVDRVDQLTRLNRQFGVGVAMITHTMSDLLALPTEEDRMKARGFVERAGMVVVGGLPAAEMPLLTAALPFSKAEQELITGWSAPPSWDATTGRESDPPGRGKFLVKVGGRPGIPIQIKLTQTERSINDTNKLWATQSRVGRVEEVS